MALSQLRSLLPGLLGSLRPVLASQASTSLCASWADTAGACHRFATDATPPTAAEAPDAPVSGSGRSPPPFGSGGLQADKQVPVINWQGEQVATYTLPGHIFDVPVRKDILHRVVRWQRAKKQQGTHKTKTRSEVSGGGRKPHNQKGSGKARAGTIRAPQWRGGGVAHGPVVRSHAHDLPKKVRRLGLKCALAARAIEGRLVVLDTLALDEPKTKVLDQQLHSLVQAGSRHSFLMIDSGKTAEDGGESVRRAASNLPWTDVLPQEGINVYSILQRDHLVLTRPAVDLIIQRLNTPIRRGVWSDHARQWAAGLTS
ncbi:hypothetical protein WJX72_001953 [[Myrmecia] bisecta]|uniref:Large ribosomal subunit protein uL4m n=1 Tax=[Myrmecia] bisecta TaxID=41462 RepID=A0AAW1QPH9_9CHLO